ncbi:MAG TPA: hypothetical protein VFL42_12055 [Terriglobales bacterium]|nr:hypothetical protein [Terriglobales bacterium]
MYSRKISVQYQAQGRLEPCPIKWLDNFAMRNFTNAPLFDDTLPVADGELEIGARVPLDSLKAALEDWFKKKGYLDKNGSLLLAER